MAKFPGEIQYLDIQAPRYGPNAEIHPEIRTGAGIVAQAIGGMGEVLSEIDQKIQVAEDAMELSSLNRKREEIAVAGFAQMEETQDPAAIDAIYEKMVKDAGALGSKRTKVNDLYIQGLNNDAPRWRASYKDISRRKRIARLEDENKINDQKDYELGNKFNFKKRREQNVQLGIETPEMAANKLENFHVNSVFAKAMIRANTDPDNALEMLGALRNLNAEQTLQKDRIVAHIQSVQNQKTQAQIVDEEALWDLSIKPKVTSEDILRAVDALPRHTAAEKDQLYKSTMSRVKMINEGKGDPYIYRQDTARYWELYQNAVDGKGTEKDFREAVRDHKITINDYKELNNVIEGLTPKSTADEMGTAMKRLKTLIESSGADLGLAEGYKEAVDSAVIMGETILETKIAEAKAANKPLKGVDLTKEVLRVSRDMKTKMEEGKSAEEILPLNVEAVLAGYQKPTQAQFISVIGFLKRAGRDKDAQDYYNRWVNELWP